MAKQNLPNSVTGGLNYVSEKQKYTSLYESNRTQTGQTSFTSTTSGVTYNTAEYPLDNMIYNKGEEGLLQLLKNVLKDYLLTAEDIDLDSTLSSNSDNKIPTQKAVKAYVDNRILNKQIFTSNGTFITPKDGTYKVTVVGSGGNGGQSSTSGTIGSGGGGGGLL